MDLGEIVRFQSVMLFGQFQHAVGHLLAPGFVALRAKIYLQNNPQNAGGVLVLFALPAFRAGP
jgi:hypothetical protein